MDSLLAAGPLQEAKDQKCPRTARQFIATKPPSSHPKKVIFVRESNTQNGPKIEVKDL